MALAGILAFLLFFSACSGSQHAANPTGDRPGDQLETIPGYISRMRGIEVARSGDSIDVTAAPGTFAAVGGTPDTLVVRAFSTTPSTIEAIVDSPAGMVPTGSPYLARFRPNADGSAQATLPGSLMNSDIVLFSVATEEDEASAGQFDAFVSPIETQAPTLAYRMIGLSGEAFEPVYRNAFNTRQWDQFPMMIAGGAGADDIVTGSDGDGNTFVAYIEHVGLSGTIWVSRRPAGGGWEERVSAGTAAANTVLRLAVTGDGMAMVAWVAGSLYAKPYVPGMGWLPDVQLASSLSLEGIAVAAGIGTFAIGSVDDAQPGIRRVQVHRFSAAGWFAPETLLEEPGTAEGSLTPHFTPTGMVALYNTRQALYSFRKIGASWLSPQLVASPILPAGGLIGLSAVDSLGNMLCVYGTTPIQSRIVRSDDQLDAEISTGRTGYPVYLSLASNGASGLFVYKVEAGTTSLLSLDYRDGGWSSVPSLIGSWSFRAIVSVSDIAADPARVNALFIQSGSAVSPAIAKRYVMGLGWKSDSMFPPGQFPLTSPAIAFLPDGSATAIYRSDDEGGIVASSDLR